MIGEKHTHQSVSVSDPLTPFPVLPSTIKNQEFIDSLYFM